MRHFATESGKSKGQFYTPAEVSRIMAKVIGVGDAKTASQTIHDPTCGSGSLLLKAHDEAKSATGLDLALYGQEMDNATKALARMNMILHDCPTAEIWQDNTLSSAALQGRQDRRAQDLRLRRRQSAVLDQGVEQGLRSRPTICTTASPSASRRQKNGDYAFLLHILACLKSTGKGAVILPHGVLFRGGAEADIRREIVKRGYIKGIIGLPANLFYGTGIPACILVLDKENAPARKGIFMIDASKGFIKDGNKNRLRAPGHPQDRRRLHAPGRDPALLAHGAAGGDQRREERLQPEPSAVYRQQRAGGHPGHRRPPARRHSRARPRRTGAVLAGVPRRARGAVHEGRSPRL